MNLLALSGATSLNAVQMAGNPAKRHSDLIHTALGPRYGRLVETDRRHLSGSSSLRQGSGSPHRGQGDAGQHDRFPRHEEGGAG